ncbi:hypothetical protein ACI65C_012914 [Semiaphis heraclei]
MAFPRVGTFAFYRLNRLRGVCACAWPRVASRPSRILLAAAAAALRGGAHSIGVPAEVPRLSEHHHVGRGSHITVRIISARLLSYRHHRRVPVSSPTATRPLHSSRPLPTPRAQQQHQHDQYTSSAAPRFAATAATTTTTTTLLATPNQTATLWPRSEVRSLYIPRRVRTPAPARRFVSGGRTNDRKLVAI